VRAGSGPETPRQVQGLTAVRRSGHDVKIVTEMAADRFQKVDVIVGQEDARSARRCHIQLRIVV
jgi:hypothetical protein